MATPNGQRHLQPCAGCAIMRSRVRAGETGVDRALKRHQPCPPGRETASSGKLGRATVPCEISALEGFNYRDGCLPIDAQNEGAAAAQASGLCGPRGTLVRG